MTLSSPLKVSECKPKNIKTLPVNLREACGVMAVIFNGPYTRPAPNMPA